MIIDSTKLRQLFKNRSNCYADAENVVQAMDEDCFVDTVKEALTFAVSEQFTCKRCGSHKKYWSTKNDDWYCKICGHICR